MSIRVHPWLKKLAEQITTSMKNWLVYILRCRDDTLYTGITNDLENRLQSHNEKRGARYTRARLPVTLVYQEEATSRSQASRREAAIKKLTRQKKLKLINEYLI